VQKPPTNGGQRHLKFLDRVRKESIEMLMSFNIFLVKHQKKFTTSFCTSSIQDSEPKILNPKILDVR